MARRAGAGLVVFALMGVLAATPALADGSSGGKEASPYVVGAWKFVPPTSTGQAPAADTEFRFINPTNLTATLEYAFFENDGTFCGCDRDDFPPNKTTIYTMLQELQLGPAMPGGPSVFSCKGTSGALKSIVFLHSGQDISLGEASQVGFQTHALGDIVEPDQNFVTLFQGKIMTEAALQPVPIDDATRAEIAKIHEQCVTVNGPLSP